jgi:phosphoglycolate phosphatase-like HAD superfamily hydrolase
MLPLPPEMKRRLKNSVLANVGFISALSLSRPVRHSEARREEAMAHFCEPRRRKAALLSLPPPDAPPGTIAVHLHLYYIDMLDEFRDWLSRVPYPFDLFVSVADGASKQAVYQGFTDLPNVRGVRVEAAPNRGRDVAPMILTFPGLADYDYFLHIHSKKSPHLAGAFDWRGHLLTNLLRDETHIRRLFKLFELYPELGIVYPEPSAELPYWSLTALINESGMRRLFELIDVPFPEGEKYIDFPVGTMFWARGDALRKLFASRLTLEDFPEEAGQLDGTLSHAVERGLCLIAADAGYLPAQIDAASDTAHIGPGARNLAEYLATGASDMEQYLRRFKHAAFDIFGTLVCSGFDSGNGGDFESLMNNCKPRGAVADVCSRLSAQGVEIVLADDTSLPAEQVERLLEACGITGWKDIYISGDTGLYKKDGGMYDFLKERFNGQPFAHVGNHELDDVHTPNGRSIPAFHVMHPHDMMKIGLLGEAYFDRCRDDPFCLPELMRALSNT